MDNTKDYQDSTSGVLAEVYTELMRAKSVYPEHFVNQHEAYAVILEEVDELWTEIKKKPQNYDIPAQRKEAIQAAAMLVRLIVELLPKTKNRLPTLIEAFPYDRVPTIT